MVPIVDSQQLLLAGERGILKATMKGQAIKNYFQNQVNTICHIEESIYLVGFYSNGLKVWNEKTDQELFQICKETLFSIKRILTTNTFIIKTYKNGIKILTIKNLKTSEFSLQDLLDAKDTDWNTTDSLQVQYVANSHLVIAAAQNENS